MANPNFNTERVAESENQLLVDLQRSVSASLQQAQARVDSAEDVTFADRVALASAQSQLKWLEQIAADDETLAFKESEKELGIAADERNPLFV